MTDPQLPPPPPYGSVPPVPPAPVPPYQQPGPYQQSAPYQQPGPYQQPQSPQPAPVQQPAASPQLAYQTPPGAYAAPVGGYVTAEGAYHAPPVEPKKSGALGVVAFLLSAVAAVVAPIIVGVTAYQIGYLFPAVQRYISPDTDDFSFLAPVRDQVLVGEISFWSGTIIGIAAIVLGIMAIVKRQGRGWGIGALVLGILGPIVFGVVLTVCLSVGVGAAGFAYTG